jgi:hypothetical protein
MARRSTGQILTRKAKASAARPTGWRRLRELLKEENHLGPPLGRASADWVL